MSAWLSDTFIAALLFGAVTAAVPLLLAGLGEQMSQKAGVLNIGIEGMMILGAYCGFVGALAGGAAWVGFVCGAIGGVLAAGVMAVMCVLLGLNQIVVGIGITLGLEGLTALLHHFYYSRSYPRLPAADTWSIPVLADWPVLGEALFAHSPLAYLAVALVVLLSLLYRRTRVGLWLQAAGDRPEALDIAGIDVYRVRFVAVLVTGVLAGLGGASLSIVGAGTFVPYLTNGAGFIGIVLAMLARGRPLWVLAGALVFGGCLAMTTALQVVGVDVPIDVIQMLPFLAVMIMLVAFGRRASLPASLALPYHRGAR